MKRTGNVLRAVFLAALCATAAGAQSGLLRGVVHDPEGNPLSGVRLTVTSEELSSFHKTVTTNKKGTFTLRFQPMQVQYRFELLFEKTGYQSFNQPISPSAMVDVREIYIMEPAQSQVVERHGDLSSVVTGSTNAAVNAFNTGLTAQREGDLETARASFAEALEADPSLAPAHIALAQVLVAQREHDAAVDSADRALALAGGNADALRVKLQALQAAGRRAEADEVVVALEEAEDAVATARRLYNEGGEAFQADDRETALARFQRAAQLDPSLIDAHHAVATLELANGNHETAAEAAQTALSLGSDNVATLRVLYDAYDALGRVEELTEIAPRLAAVDPDFGGSKLVEQASQLWNGGHAEKAVSLSHQALAIDPGLGRAYYFIGLDHLSNGENEAARAALERFLELTPEDAEAATAREMLSYIE